MLILFNKKEANLKEKAIDKMITGQINFLRNAFNLWRNQAHRKNISGAIEEKDKEKLIE